MKLELGLHSLDRALGLVGKNPSDFQERHPGGQKNHYCRSFFVTCRPFNSNKSSGPGLRVHG